MFNIVSSNNETKHNKILRLLGNEKTNNQNVVPRTVMKLVLTPFLA